MNIFNDDDVMNLTKGVMTTATLVQGLFEKFSIENDGDTELALKLTSIAWHGLATGIGMAHEDDTDDLF